MDSSFFIQSFQRSKQFTNFISKGWKQIKKWNFSGVSMINQSITQFYLMNSFTIERAASLYNHHIRHLPTKKSFQTNETANESLPNIQFNKSLEKANVLRNQLNDTMSQIAIMESKINNLKKLKQKNQQKNQKNLTKIQFITSVKERIRHDFQYKQKIQKQKQEQLQTLKHQTESFRESLITERKNAQNQLYTIKYNQAEEERRRKKHHQYLRRKLKELETLEISRKVEKVREFHENSASRIKDFRRSRVNISRENYEQKVITTLKEKERARSLLEKLKLQEQKLINDVKASQQTMLTSLYSLQSLNPQTNKKKFNSIGKTHQYEIADYQNEQFQA